MKDDKNVQKIKDICESVYGILHDDFKFDNIINEIEYYETHKTKILTEFIQRANHIGMFKGEKEMVKYIEENFDVFPLHLNVPND